MATTIKEVMAMKGNAPYQKPLTVSVVAVGQPRSYTNEKQETRQSLVVGLADKTRAVKGTVYDSSKFPRFRAGATVTLKNIIRKPDLLLVTSMSKVFPATPLTIPADLLKDATEIVFPPKAALKRISDVKALPNQSRVSVEGKLVQEEASTLKDTKYATGIPFKTIQLADATGQIKIAMWRDMAQQDLSVGQYLHFSDVVVNHFKGEAELSTVSITTTKIIDAPEETRSIVAVSVTLENQMVTVLLEDDSDVSIHADLVLAVLSDISEDELEQHVVENGPFRMECLFRGGEVVAIASIVKV